MGIEMTLLDAPALEDLAAHTRPSTCALYLETPTNPTLRVIDLEKVCARAKAAGLPVLVDSTFATPINQRPLEFGASMVLHSATKFLGGHGDITLGVAAGSGAALRKLKELRIDMGGVPDPEAAWLLGRSLKTLPLRMRAHNENAMAAARHLEGRPDVALVHYPGLDASPAHALAKRQMSGFGGMLSFELKGGVEAARRFVAGLRIIKLLPTLGGAETTVSIPALSSHFSLTEEERARAGVTPGLIRLSAGIEAAEDILDDLDRGLEVAGRDAGSPR
jgi:cystathionine beta-lyase/cystathionine gamma-synthase